MNVDELATRIYPMVVRKQVTEDVVVGPLISISVSLSPFTAKWWPYSGNNCKIRGRFVVHAFFKIWYKWGRGSWKVICCWCRVFGWVTVVIWMSSGWWRYLGDWQQCSQRKFNLLLLLVMEKVPCVSTFFTAGMQYVIDTRSTQPP